MVTNISTTAVFTKKKHKCFACWRTFEPNTMMIRSVNVGDGIYSIYACTTCNVLMQKHEKYFLDEQENDFPQECVKEMFREFNVNSPEKLLTVLDAK